MSHRRPEPNACGATRCSRRRSAVSKRHAPPPTGLSVWPAPPTTAGTGYGLNAAAVAEWALGNHGRSLDAHRQAIALLDQLDDPWGLAVCHVLQARTLFDLGDDTAAAVARVGVGHARRAGDRHVLGIALTQIAQIAMAG